MGPGEHELNYFGNVICDKRLGYALVCRLRALLIARETGEGKLLGHHHARSNLHNSHRLAY